jgi:HEPN domain-containing protein
MQYFIASNALKKSIKTLLEMEKVVVRDHDISDIFTLYILKKEKDKTVKKNLYEILEILDWFKGTWILSRYPVMKKGIVISPFEQYDKEDAEFAVDKAKFVFNFLSTILTDKYEFKKEERIDKDK